MENLFFEEKLLPALEKKGYRSYICKRMNSSGNKQVKKKKKRKLPAIYFNMMLSIIKRRLNKIFTNIPTGNFILDEFFLTPSRTTTLLKTKG